MNSPPAEPLTVLVVDDDEGVRLSLAAVLRSRNFQVVTAAGGSEALEHFRAHASICAVILDLSMPGLSGMEVYAQLRAARPALPILIASGYGDAAAPLPADPRLRFIQKSLGPKALLRQLDLLLSEAD